MSRTFKDRPLHVRAFDPHGDQFGKIKHDGLLHGSGECDAHRADSLREYFRTCCSPIANHHGAYASERTKRTSVADWHRAHRAANGRAVRALRDAANSGDVESAEDMIDNRQPARFAVYGGGYWD